MLLAFGGLTLLLLLATRRKKREPDRYSRQRLVLGWDGSQSLHSSSVLVIGCGGLASGCLPVLVGSGISKVGLVDFDLVEASNLHRQTIHKEAGLGEAKALSAQRYVSELNSQVKTVVFPEQICTAARLGEIISKQGFDLVIDCTDNVRTRRLVNQACIDHGVPLVFASALGTFGQLGVFWPCRFPTAGCFECAFPAAGRDGGEEDSCSTAGVLGPIPSVIGGLQALEAIKLLAQLRPRQVGDSKPFNDVVGKLTCFEFDILDGASVSSIRLRQRPGCDACGGVVALGGGEQSVLEGHEVIGIEPEDFVVDVRSRGAEFLGADLRLPLDRLRSSEVRLWNGLLPNDDDHQRIVCVCDTGTTSRIAARVILFHRPQLEVCSLQGGLSAFF
ncbi:hypothetical protein BASA81_007804 [Batrachochytrium salamandrivorans]|nr:hypothetical protein BASA81_007804 [Batrachochytrium salamandrivorans]